MTAALRGKVTPANVMLAFVLALFGAIACSRAWIDIFEIAWEQPEYQHIFLVPLVAVYLAYVRRQRLKYLRVQTVGLGTSLVLAGWGLNWLGNSHSFATWMGYQDKIALLIHVSAVVVLVGCVTAALGKQILFRFFPVAVVLLLMVPFPNNARHELSDHLQQYTAQIASYLLALVGVDTEVLGNTLVINSHPVFIDEACNGMRMVFPLLLIAYGFAFGLPLRASIRWIIVLASPLVALACNVLRVLPLVWLQGQGPNGQTWGNRLHDQSGWIMVPLAFLVLLGLIRLLKWAMLPVYRYPLASQSA